MRRSPAALALSAVLVVLLAAGLAAAHGINHLSADPQASADGVVRMESTFATEDGFVVLYRDDGGERGAVVASRPFSASTRDVEDVPVRVPASTWADLPANVTLHAVLHGDDGDGEFEPDADPPLASFGQVAGDAFVVRKGPTAYVGAASGGGLQRTADPRVRVRSVRLPERGYVVLRNSSGGSPSEVVGVAALDAGAHSNVSVTLDGAFFESQTTNETFSVWAHVYADDGDGEFDEGDRPIRAEDEIVGTRFGVGKLPQGTTVTPTPGQGSLVNTGSATASATPTARSSTATAPASGDAGGGGGFGPAVALAAAAAVGLALALGRARRR